MKRATALGWLKHDVTNRGVTAWLLSGTFLAFYIILYFGHLIDKKQWGFTHNLIFAAIAVLLVLMGVFKIRERKREGENPNSAIIFLVASLALTAFSYFLPMVLYKLNVMKDPLESLAQPIFGQKHNNKWMLYGLGYSIFITIGGFYMIWKYRHNRYQIIRTSVVMFVQIVFGFSIPWILKLFKYPDYYFSYIWPLKIDYFYPSTIAYQFKAGLPVPVIVYSFVAGLVIAPVLAVFFGKRWYCSWVCGCGGLANTFGEPWRHLSDNSSTAWRFEKVSIHAVLVFSLLVTGFSLFGAVLPKEAGVAAIATEMRGVYGVLITAVLSGVVGVGLYPIGGTRVWCRFACPMAALLGLVQKFGRFRIRVKQDMCISCGMCSKYCEMGIDVRSYAQANQSFTRASCVGCGLCAEVCPRGVLRLENVNRKDAQELTILKLNEGWKRDQSNINYHS